MPVSAPAPVTPQGSAAAGLWSAEDGHPFRVTAIGSCRVAGPLRKGLRDAMAPADVALNQSGVYGYCHSSAEALQQISALQGDVRIPQKLAPLIAPSGLRAEDHRMSDMYIVELSSAKMLTTHGHFIQLNYLTRHFEAFFAERARARAFWQHARSDDAQAMQSFLQDQNAYWALSEDDRALLKDVRLQMATPQRLAEDISKIAAKVPDVLFVTHFNAAKRDGTFLKSRSTFIEMTTRVLRDLKQPFFDPSDYVEVYGAHQALDHNSGSLTHYSASFEMVLWDNWLRRYIRPAMARRVSTQHRPDPDNPAPDFRPAFA